MATTPSRPARVARPPAAATELVAQKTVVIPAAGQRSCVEGVTAPGGSFYDVLGDATCNVTGAGVLTTAAGAVEVAVAS